MERSDINHKVALAPEHKPIKTTFAVCCCKHIEYFEKAREEIIDKYLLLESKEDFHCYDVFEFNNKFYSVGSIMPKDKIVIVHEFTPIPDEVVEKSYSDRQITCPYCGHENRDSWEKGDSEEEEECGVCGSTFAWERDVAVTYSSVPIKRNKIKVIKQ